MMVANFAMNDTNVKIKSTITVAVNQPECLSLLVSLLNSLTNTIVQ